MSPSSQCWLASCHVFLFRLYFSVVCLFTLHILDSTSTLLQLDSVFPRKADRPVSQHYNSELCSQKCSSLVACVCVLAAKISLQWCSCDCMQTPYSRGSTTAQSCVPRSVAVLQRQCYKSNLCSQRCSSLVCTAVIVLLVFGENSLQHGSGGCMERPYSRGSTTAHSVVPRSVCSFGAMVECFHCCCCRKLTTAWFR